MKKMKKILPAFAMLVLAAVLMSTASYAWFSTNKKVDVDGIQVQVQAPASLVITTSLPTGTDVGNAVTLDAGSQSTTLNPVTYVSADKTYKVPEASAVIDAATGLVTSGNLVAVNTGAGYYVDYVVYISTAVEEMTGKTLTANVTFTNTKTDGAAENPQPLALESTQKATTVGFAYQTVTKTDGALNVANFPVAQEQFVKICANDTSTSSAIHTGTISIPLNSADTVLAVTMRVYIDGALGELVNSKTYSLDALKIAISFTVD